MGKFLDRVLNMTMGMTEYIFKIILLIILAIILLPVFFKTNEQYHFSDIEKKTNLSFKKCKIIKSSDTHGGFHGDGYKKVIYKCGDKFNTKNIKKKWKKIPFTENINIKLYGDAKKNGIEYLPVDEKDYAIPKIENGYYYFIDQYSREHKDVKNIYSDEKLLSRYSENFTLTVYDMDNNLLYYYGVDT